MKKVIIIVAVLIVLGAGGYFAYTKFFKTGGAAGVLPGKLSSECKYNDPDLCKFVNNWKNIKSYTLTANDTTDGVATQMVFKFSNDKSQLIFTQGGKEVNNIISIGDSTYTKDYSDNQWWKSTSTPSPTGSPVEEEVTFDESDPTTYQKIGSEACGNLTCLKYQVLDPAATDTTQFIFFDTKDYLLRKMTMVDKDGNASETTVDYNRVTVSEPSPVKSGSPYQGSLPGE